MKKFWLILLAAALIAAGWFILLRPEEISEEALRKDFETKRTDFETVASYLSEKHIVTNITGFFHENERYGIPFEDTDEYRAFADSMSNLITYGYEAIKCDGETVEFVQQSTGGILNRRNGSIIYNGKSEIEGKKTVSPAQGWHILIIKP